MKLFASLYCRVEYRRLKDERYKNEGMDIL